MPELADGTLLFYGGIAGMALAVVGSIVAIITLRISGKRLRVCLEEEFGNKRN